METLHEVEVMDCLCEASGMRGCACCTTDGRGGFTAVRPRTIAADGAGSIFIEQEMTRRPGNPFEVTGVVASDGQVVDAAVAAMSRSASLINVPLRFKIPVEICRVDHGLIDVAGRASLMESVSCADACSCAGTVRLNSDTRTSKIAAMR